MSKWIQVTGGGGSSSSPGVTSAPGPARLTFCCNDTTPDDNVAHNLPITGAAIGVGSVLTRIIGVWRTKGASPANLVVRFRLQYAGGVLHTVATVTLPSGTAVATAVEFNAFDWPTFPDKAVLLIDVISSNSYKNKNGVAAFVLVYVGRGAGMITTGLGLEGVWNSGTTYAIDALVSTATGLWRSLQDGNTNHEPVEGVWWTLVIPAGTPGEDGDDGAGLPPGGLTGDMPVKQSDDDFDIGWTPAPRSFPPVAHEFLTGWSDLTGEFSSEQPTEADLSLSDITTNNVTIARHGLVPKLPNDATKYLDGTGAWSVPPGSGSTPPTVLYSFVTEADGTLIYDAGAPILDAYTL